MDECQCCRGKRLLVPYSPGPAIGRSPRERIFQRCGTTGWDQRLNKLVCLPLTCVKSAGLKQKPAISENPKPGWQRHWKSTWCKFSWDREPEWDTVIKKQWLSFRTFGPWNIRLSYYHDLFSPLKTRNCQDFSKKFARYTWKINSHWATMSLYNHK